MLGSVWTKVFVLTVAISFLLTGTASAFEWKVTEFENDGNWGGGDVKFLPNGFIITSTGGDIWSEKVGCTLVYLDGGWTGDFTIEYTIEEHTAEPPLTWSKCGVMVAQTLDPQTAYVFIQSAPSNEDAARNNKGAKIITRPDYGGTAAPGSDGWAPLEWPVTYRMTREGDLFSVWVSIDGGKTFETIENPIADPPKETTSTLALTDPVVLGFALNGNEANGAISTATAKIVNIKINGENAYAVDVVGKLATTWAKVKTY